MPTTCRAGSRVVDGRMVGRRTIDGPPLVSFEKQDRRRARPQGRRSDRRQRARPQHHRAHRQPAHASTGRASASISCWCSRPAPSPARRTRDIATLTYPGGGTPAQEAALLKAVGDDFPDGHHGAGQGRARGGRRHRRAISCSAIRGASAITLVAAVLVLGGALAAGHRHRVYDAVVLKTLGATRGAAARRLCARIPAARRRHRAVRRAGRLARGLADRDRADESALCLAAGAGAGRGARRASRSRSRSGCSAPSRRSARSRRRCCGICRLRDIPPRRQPAVATGSALYCRGPVSVRAVAKSLRAISGADASPH